MSAIPRLAVGIALVGLVLWLNGGAGGVLEALSAGGGMAVVVIAVYHLVPTALCGIAWWLPFAEAPPGLWKDFLLARWIRDAINQVLPFMPLGGEVLGARMVAGRGVPGTTMAALTVVDVTAEVLSQVAFCMIGVGFWLSRHPAAGLPKWAWVGLLLMLPMAGGLLAAQKMGLVKLLEKIADKVMPDAWRRPEETRSIHDILIALYARRQRFWAATAVHLVAWLAATVEAWMALRIIGHPLSWADVVTLESVIYAVRAAAFLVPAGLGVQEGTYLLVGTALGLPPEAALALALIKRGREFALGLPAVLFWQFLSRGTAPRFGS